MELPVFWQICYVLPKVLKDTNRKSGTNTRSDRKTDEIPDDEEDHPDHFKDNSDRKKVGNKSTDLYADIGVTAFVGESPSL